MKNFKILFIFLVIVLSPGTSVFAVGTLIKLDSIEYDSGGTDEAQAVAVDSQDNVIVSGYHVKGGYPDWFTIKYNSDLVVVSSVSYAGAAGSTDSATAVAVDSQDNIIVAGYSHNGVNDDWLTIKYDNDLVVISSSTFGVGTNDQARDIAVDSQDNIIVTGKYNNKGYTVKYSTNFIIISSAAFSTSYPGVGVAVDSQDNIFIVQETRYVVKYSSALEEISSALPEGDYFENDPTLKIIQYNTSGGFDIAVDSADNIFTAFNAVMEYEVTSGELGTYGSLSCFIAKYDNDLTEISLPAIEVFYPMPSWRYYSLAVDSADNIIAAGYDYKPLAAAQKDCYTVKHDPDIAAVSSASYAGSGDEPDRIYGSAIDSRDNIIVAGYVDNGTDLDWAVVKYFGGSPTLNALSVGQGIQGKTYDISLSGEKFYAGAALSFSGSGITVNSTTVNSLSNITANITIAPDAALGKRDAIITNIDTANASISAVFEVKSASLKNSNIEKDLASTMTLEALSGDIVIDIPAATFSDDVTMTIASVEVALPDRVGLKKTDLGIDISVSSGEQPLKDITVKINYRDSDIADVDESKLVLCRYDPINLRWITLPTVVYADDNYLIATIDHLSVFGVLQLAPASDLKSVKTFPNPYNPLTDGNLTFDNITSVAVIKIYTVSGTLVKKLKETDANGRLLWDGKNNGGETVASGIYLAYIESPSDTKIVKIAVVK